MKNGKGLLLALFALVAVSSCKNFMNGGEVLGELQNTIDFLTAPYVKVTVVTDNQATKSISPSVGVYDSKYKKTSRIALSFEETDLFQFTNWVCEPDGAVVFEDATARATIATIESDDTEIKVYPQVYSRPGVSFAPSNLIVSPKNTAAVITFDNIMELTDEQIASIDIQIENLSILDSFEPPLCSNADGFTTITYVANRNKLLELSSSTAIINIIVPAELGYTSSNNNLITLNKQIIYSYKINNETQDKAKIAFTAAAAEGELSFAENLTYSLDQEVSSKFTPSPAYQITGWKVVYENGDEVEPSIVRKTVSADKYTVTVKLLTGTDRQITVKPVCQKRKTATISFSSTHGSLSLTEPKVLYAGESFSIKYFDEANFDFTGWNVYQNGVILPAETLANILTIDNATQKDITVTIKPLQQDYELLLKAECAQRKAVTLSFATTHGTLSTSEKKVLNAGNSFKISYTEDPSFQFTGWNFYSEGIIVPAEKLASILSFDDSVKDEITVSIKNIQADYALELKAECEPRPQITFAPENNTVHEKNTAISITFDHSMQITNEQLAAIDIQISNLSVLSNFDAPQKTDENGKTIISFTPLRSNLLMLESSTATINVVVPAGFYYITESGKQIVTLEKTIYAFKINNETLDSANIEFTSPQGEGIISYSGKKKYSLDEEMSSTFTPTTEYTLTGWKNYYIEGEVEKTVPDNIVRKTFANNNSQITVKLISGFGSTIYVKPVCVASTHLDVTLESQYGRISPIEFKKLYSNESLSFSFFENSDYVFLHWDIFDSSGTALDPAAISGWLTTDTTKAVTQIQVGDIPETSALKFVAVCTERPVILSTLPAYTDEGIYRDARIRVMFDRPIALDSFFYTETEKESIIAEKNLPANAFSSFETGFTAPENAAYKYYGYKDSAGEIHYKNITIVNNKNKTNLLEYYDAPYFEVPEILVIPAKNGEGAPAPGTEILVTIEADAHYTAENKPVCIASAKKWSYFVNSTKDTTPPDISEQIVKVKKYNESEYTKNNGETEARSTALSSITEMQGNFANTEDIQVSVAFSDQGSGPASLSLEVYNLDKQIQRTYSLPLELDGKTAKLGTEQAPL